jgi:hypothetical protein
MVMNIDNLSSRRVLRPVFSVEHTIFKKYSIDADAYIHMSTHPYEQTSAHLIPTT